MTSRAISDDTRPLPTNSLPANAQDMLTALVANAERNWKDFTQSTNGQVLLESPEIPREQAIKLAYTYGHVAAETSSVAAFIQDGMNAFLLPHRRIVWRGVDQLKITEGQMVTGILFISQCADGKNQSIYQGWVNCAVPHPELGEQVPLCKPVITFLTDLGGEGIREIKGVVAWVELTEVLKTFIR